MIKLIGRLQLGSIVLPVMLGSAFPAAAETAHSNAISCYAYVHSQCYGNGGDNCSQEDYEWGLDQCDGYYPSKGVVRPKRPGGLASQTTDARTRAAIERSFKKR